MEELEINKKRKASGDINLRNKKPCLAKTHSILLSEKCTIKDAGVLRVAHWNLWDMGGGATSHWTKNTPEEKLEALAHHINAVNANVMICTEIHASGRGFSTRGRWQDAHLRTIVYLYGVYVGGREEGIDKEWWKDLYVQPDGLKYTLKTEAEKKVLTAEEIEHDKSLTCSFNNLKRYYQSGFNKGNEVKDDLKKFGMLNSLVDDVIWPEVTEEFTSLMVKILDNAEKQKQENEKVLLENATLAQYVLQPKTEKRKNKANEIKQQYILDYWNTMASLYRDQQKELTEEEEKTFDADAAACMEEEGSSDLCQGVQLIKKVAEKLTSLKTECTWKYVIANEDIVSGETTCAIYDDASLEFISKEITSVNSAEFRTRTVDIYTFKYRPSDLKVDEFNVAGWHAPAPDHWADKISCQSCKATYVAAKKKVQSLKALTFFVGDFNIGTKRSEEQEAKTFFSDFLPILEDHKSLSTSYKLIGDSEKRFNEPYDKVLIYKPSIRADMNITCSKLKREECHSSAESARKYSDHSYVYLDISKCGKK